MSNVKTGDLARVIACFSGEPICTVGPSAIPGSWVKIETNVGELMLQNAFEQYWWCDFPRPFDLGRGLGVPSGIVFATRLTLPDSILRRISGPDVVVTSDLEVFAPGLIDPDERFREKQRKLKDGTVKNKEKGES